MSWGAVRDDEATWDCMVLWLGSSAMVSSPVSIAIDIAIDAMTDSGKGTVQTETVPASLPLWGVVMRFARKAGRVWGS